VLICGGKAKAKTQEAAANNFISATASYQYLIETKFASISSLLK